MFELTRKAWRAARAWRRRQRVVRGLAQGLREAGLSAGEVRLLLRHARESGVEDRSSSTPRASALTRKGDHG